jgi:Flp pilus assembly protein TadG
MGQMRRFLSDVRGGVAINFALALIPICIILGGAIDFSRAMSAKSHLRDTLDAAALAVGATPNFTLAQAQVIADNFSTANYPSQDLGAPPHITSIAANNEQVTVNGEATVPSTMLGLIGIQTIKVKADVTVQRAGNNMEAALVLDVTGSMAGTRIADLKTAAKDFVDVVVADQQTPYYTKVALVPFSMGVNVGSLANQVRGTPTAGTCNTPGCNKYTFTNASGNSTTWTISANCVTERTGTDKYTDVAPSTARVGRIYLENATDCLSSQIVPLSSNKSSLKSTINSLVAEGTTAGHIGTAWGWYMLSPNFSYLFSGSSKPAAYGAAKTIKTVVIMTDGEYNTAYCKGVLSNDSSGSNSDQINCNATNGDPTAQAKQICTNIKAKGIIVYTVGFDLGNSTAALDMLSSCATDAAHFYRPNTGSELKSAFQSIAQSISNLRIAH